MLYKLSLIFIMGISFNVKADPFIKKNLEVHQINYGNINVTSNIDNIDTSFIQIGAAGNAVNLSNNVENLSLFMENYGNISANATISSVNSSFIQVSAVGNSVTVQ